VAERVGQDRAAAPFRSARRRVAIGPLLVALLAAVGGQLPARADPRGVPPAALQERLDELLAKVPASTQIGLVVADADSGQPWLAYQPDTPLKPASVQKLLVTAAALDRFGPGFRYQTRVYLYRDELWVVGAGDPGLGDQRIADRYGRPPGQVFDEWAAALQSRGAASLAKIILDDSIFDQQARHPDWPDDQADRWYQAPVGGLNINDNCLDVSVVVRGRRVELRLQPDLPPECVRNGITRGKNQRPVLKRPLDSDFFQLSGTVATGGDLDPVCAGRPTLFFAYALKRGLERRGIVVRGDVVRRPLTAGELAAATPLATYSTGLPDVLWRCNTFSQNLFAECVLKSLAAYEPDGRRSGTPGSWDGGRSVLHSTLAQLGLDLTAATIRDGSGLSHHNRVTADQLVRLLVRMWRHPHAGVFSASLAEPGQPGSMQRRYDVPALRGRVRGKTGSIAGVRSLAGYLTRPDGTVLAFALLINGPSDAALPLKVCEAMVTADPPAGAR
jgi:D-alanyl-D-alanine carboxypeptidase/D-alanyl-D-alanine-endopeptidase (penicillin-binding protein 4)